MTATPGNPSVAYRIAAGVPASRFIAPAPLDLVSTPVEVLAVTVPAIIAG